MRWFQRLSKPGVQEVHHVLPNRHGFRQWQWQQTSYDLRLVCQRRVLWQRRPHLHAVSDLLGEQLQVRAMYILQPGYVFNLHDVRRDGI